MLLFGYKESETNLRDLLITNLSVFIAKTITIFFSTEHYPDFQNIFLGKKKLSENIMQQESWLNQIFSLGEKSQ